MTLVPVRVTPINGLDEIQAHQGEMPAEDVRRLDVDAVIDTRYYYRLLPEAVVEQLGLTVMWRGTVHPDGAWREGYVASVLTVELFGRRGSMMGWSWAISCILTARCWARRTCATMRRAVSSCRIWGRGSK
jgi:hypothetical protein